jgi:hypothetical protein
MVQVRLVVNLNSPCHSGQLESRVNHTSHSRSTAHFFLCTCHHHITSFHFMAPQVSRHPIVEHICPFKVRLYITLSTFMSTSSIPRIARSSSRNWCRPPKRIVHSIRLSVPMGPQACRSQKGMSCMSIHSLTSFLTSPIAEPSVHRWSHQIRQ